MPTKKLPDFDQLWSNYPGGEAADVRTLIGGQIENSKDPSGNPLVSNTCATRVSRSFNYAGHPLPNRPTIAGTRLLTLRGGDSKHYLIRVRELQSYIITTYGNPKLTVRNANVNRGSLSSSEAEAAEQAAIPASFRGKKGIISFVDCGWSDATGHFDLWDGSRCAGHSYFRYAKVLNLWFDARWQVVSPVGGPTTQNGVPVVTVGAGSSGG